MPDRSPKRPDRGRQDRPDAAEIILADPAWRRALPDVARRVGRAIAAAGGAGSVMLASDRTVRRLNRNFRGIDKATNVLTFADARTAGDLVLAYGVMQREARAARRSLAHHLAHLVVHGGLHLRGADHITPGQARRMEQEETRILHRLGVPNPWKSGGV